MALLFGSEATGLSKKALANADKILEGNKFEHLFFVLPQFVFQTCSLTLPSSFSFSSSSFPCLACECVFIFFLDYNGWCCEPYVFFNVAVPGAGRVTSLNVSQSAVAILTEIMRVHQRFTK